MPAPSQRKLTLMEPQWPPPPRAPPLPQTPTLQTPLLSAGPRAGLLGGGGSDKGLSSVHSNLVCGMQYFGAKFGAIVAEFTTSSLDGKVGFWTRDDLTAAMGAVAIS